MQDTYSERFIDVNTNGNQAKDLSEAIGVLIAARFGEDF